MLRFQGFFRLTRRSGGLPLLSAARAANQRQPNIGASPPQGRGSAQQRHRAGRKSQPAAAACSTNPSMCRGRTSPANANRTPPPSYATGRASFRPPPLPLVAASVSLRAPHPLRTEKKAFRGWPRPAFHVEHCPPAASLGPG